MASYYRPQRSWAKVIFSEACVKNSVHGGGVWSRGGSSKFWEDSPNCLGGPPNFRGSPNFWGVPPNFRGVSKFLGGLQNFFSFFYQFLFPKKILLGCTNPLPPPPLRRSVRGRYASYWNAFLCYVPKETSL